MDLPKEVDDYIKETIEDSLGLPVSTTTLQAKLRVTAEANRRLQDQYFFLQDKLKHKDKLIERVKAEASMNAVAIKKFVDENQRLAAECANLVDQCNKWERECALYDRDREALMEFGNEADERAKEAEIRVSELELELGTLSEELEFYKREAEKHGAESNAENKEMEEKLLTSVLSASLSKAEVESGHAFLEANSGNESYQTLLKLWNSLRPSTRNAISLVAKVRALQNDKEHLRVNLTRAEEEVKLLFEENNILNEENRKLLRSNRRERSLDSPDGKLSSASTKRSKRRTSPKKSSPLEKKKIDFEEVDSIRPPLSPLDNSPDRRVYQS